MTVLFTLNSNLILLILAAAAVSLAFVASLNSNLILPKATVESDNVFKFQSDSINTQQR